MKMKATEKFKFSQQNQHSLKHNLEMSKRQVAGLRSSTQDCVNS